MTRAGPDPELHVREIQRRTGFNDRAIGQVLALLGRLRATGFQRFEVDAANYGALLAGRLLRCAAFEPGFLPRLIDAIECGIVRTPAVSPFPYLPASAASAA